MASSPNIVFGRNGESGRLPMQAPQNEIYHRYNEVKDVGKKLF